MNDQRCDGDEGQDQHVEDEELLARPSGWIDLVASDFPDSVCHSLLNHAWHSRYIQWILNPIDQLTIELGSRLTYISPLSLGSMICKCNVISLPSGIEHPGRQVFLEKPEKNGAF